MAQSKTSWQCSAVTASGPPGNVEGCVSSHRRVIFLAIWELGEEVVFLTPRGTIGPARM